MLQEGGVHVCPGQRCGPGIQHRAWHKADAWKVLSDGMERTKVCFRLPGDSQVSKWQERMLTEYFPHRPDGFENEKAGSRPPQLGAAHPQLPPPGNVPGKVQKSGCLSSQGQRREGV